MIEATRPESRTETFLAGLLVGVLLGVSGTLGAVAVFDDDDTPTTYHQEGPR